MKDLYIYIYVRAQPAMNRFLRDLHDLCPRGREHIKPSPQLVTLRVSMWVSAGLACGVVALCSSSKVSSKAMPALEGFHK